MVEEHFSGDISAHPVITHPNSVVALSPCGIDIAIPSCREEAQKDIVPERNIHYFHSGTMCVCVVGPVALIPVGRDATLTVHFSRILINSFWA